MHHSWFEILKPEFEKDYFIKLIEFINNERRNNYVYPSQTLVYNAFNLTPLHSLKVVIIGQDPYHGQGQANGLSFSVNDGVKFPPSLRNIFKELKSDVGCEVPFSGNLERWAKQGVLLLNATLTVRANHAASHQNKGWETFTDTVINLISIHKKNIVFILWGNYARSKKQLINCDSNFVIESAHPSPLARGAFFNSKPFSACNNYLIQHKISPISWCL
ncbi:MAG: uracil-DNA glycosylase [Bacteroidetes bacterium]|nr:uracil-DNA glycosylase [Bacteroidota bacterium]